MHSSMLNWTNAHVGLKRGIYVCYFTQHNVLEVIIFPGGARVRWLIASIKEGTFGMNLFDVP